MHVPLTVPITPEIIPSTTDSFFDPCPSTGGDVGEGDAPPDNVLGNPKLPSLETQVLRVFKALKALEELKLPATPEVARLMFAGASTGMDTSRVTIEQPKGAGVNVRKPVTSHFRIWGQAHV